jgi:hypothetical protein
MKHTLWKGELNQKSKFKSSRVLGSLCRLFFAAGMWLHREQGLQRACVQDRETDSKQKKRISIGWVIWCMCGR